MRRFTYYGNIDEEDAERLLEHLHNTGHLQDIEPLKYSEYEEIVSAIIKEKLEQQNETNTVKHKHDLQCDFGEKEMDVVLWIEEGDNKIMKIVECKGGDYEKGIDDLACFAFYLEHSDADKGIYVSRSGYQPGAVDIAEKCGIKLLEIRRIEYTADITIETAEYRHRIWVYPSGADSPENLSSIVREHDQRLTLPVLDADGNPTGDTVEDRLTESTSDGGQKPETVFSDGEKVTVDGEDYALKKAESQKRSGDEITTEITGLLAEGIDLVVRDTLSDDFESVPFDDIMDRVTEVETEE
ncbi:restriction endonuclease [Natronobacterium texcoconense]|uniref:Restriction endonuclease n=1 Tax=Natronobacterium texcoconense TaxID=1095778 RepID=A0A1H1AJ61_NATTX|nr:restriction endonuclease [Natronobacterium texcoconense]SDQ39684.1 Restriction endonuclease [Natronobacterium texcoconense]